MSAVLPDDWERILALGVALSAPQRATLLAVVRIYGERTDNVDPSGVTLHDDGSCTVLIPEGAFEIATNGGLYQINEHEGPPVYEVGNPNPVGGAGGGTIVNAPANEGEMRVARERLRDILGGRLVRFMLWTPSDPERVHTLLRTCEALQLSNEGMRAWFLASNPAFTTSTRPDRTPADAYRDGAHFTVLHAAENYGAGGFA